MNTNDTCTHGNTDCPICHKRPGECSYGSCTKRAVLRFVHESGNDVRHFCARHGVSPMYQFARAGYHMDEDI